MSTYLLINILVLIVPLIMSFERNISFYKKLPAFFSGNVLISILFILWDILATKRGDWSFNATYITGVKISYLPVEEVLFFFIIPYSSIFIFETIKFYFKERTIKFNRNIYFLLSSTALMIALLNTSRYYTFSVFLFCSILFFIIKIKGVILFESLVIIIWLVITVIPFFIVNYFLTSLPVVMYSNNAIIGFRVTTIPLEDFFYSFSLLTSNLLVYLYFKEKWRRIIKSV